MYCEIHPFDAPEEFIRNFGARGIVLSGGPETVTEDATPRIPDVVFELGCGHTDTRHLLWHAGARATARRPRAGSQKHEFGHARIRVANAIVAAFESAVASERGELNVWMSHGDKVVELPKGFEVIAATASAPIAAMGTPADDLRSAIPSRSDAHDGRRGDHLAASRATSAAAPAVDAGATSSPMRSRRWRAGRRRERACSVCRAVWIRAWSPRCLSRAIGDQLTCVFVDNGLLRLGRARRSRGDVRHQCAQPESSRRRCGPSSSSAICKGVSGSGGKRKIIGRLHRRVRRGSAQDRGRRSGWPGHDLSRCDRIRRHASPARRTSSSRITTWAGCRSACI